MDSFDIAYWDLVKQVIDHGEMRRTRNAMTKAIFGTSLTVDVRDGFPILQGRKLFYKGVFGELAALLRGPTCVEDFTKWGCNYWGSWADKDGKLNLDYGNAWRDFNGFDQIQELKYMLANDPTNRRMVISSWRPDKLATLSLPCCHYGYQFYVEQGKVLHMTWTQRSVDVMIGLPSDMLLAAAWLIAIANEFGFTAGKIKMDFGDTHIYADHLIKAMELNVINNTTLTKPVDYVYHAEPGADFCSFEPSMLELIDYNPQPAVKFNLHE